MKCFKRILSLVLVITLCAIPMNANATEKNVTSSMKKNKFVKKLVYYTILNYLKPKVPKQKKLS